MTVMNYELVVLHFFTSRRWTSLIVTFKLYRVIKAEEPIHCARSKFPKCVFLVLSLNGKSMGFIIIHFFVPQNNLNYECMFFNGVALTRAVCTIKVGSSYFGSAAGFALFDFVLLPCWKRRMTFLRITINTTKHRERHEKIRHIPL